MAYKKTTLLKFTAVILTPQAWLAHAQTPTQPVEPITVQGKSAPVLEPDVSEASGFGNVRVRDLAQSVTSLSKDVLNETALSTLSQLTRLDASLSDAYNTTGYNQSLSVRGFVLDNTYNFRRDGLPVLNIGPLALENKSRVEVLKGVSGMLSGVSAPGGIVNASTLRAENVTERGAQMSAGERGSIGAQAHFATRQNGIGLRLDASAQRLRPEIENAQGQKQFVSAAFDARLGTTKIMLDLEAQRFNQPSVPGVSPLDTDGDGVGDTLPRAQPRLNLNAQPWTLPFETRSTLAALKVQHALNPNWSAHFSAQTQRVATNDRVAFPDGCSNATTYVYPGFCANGDFDLYDFRSDNERRTLHVFDAQIKGAFSWGDAKAQITAGVQRRTFSQRTLVQAYNYSGTGNLFSAQNALPAAPEATTAGTNLDERSDEVYAMGHLALANGLHTFAGVRNARAQRASVRTDGSEAFDINQSVTTPWLGASFAVSSALNLYASWGRGAESEVVPNRPLQYTNYGAALPVLKSTQTEFGAKWQAGSRLLFTAAVFEIKKPLADDVLHTDAPSTRVAGAKEATHRGVELAAVGKLSSQLSVQTSVAWLDAKITRALNPALIDTPATNVPRLAGSIFVDYQFPQVKGLAINALISAQDRKPVVPDQSLTLPAQAQLDVGMRYVYEGVGQRVTWRLNVENATQRGGWREAPTQSWGGVYLFPMPARVVRASVTVNW